MSKALRVLDDVAERDIPNILAYHLPRSRQKAEAILAEYDRLIVLLEANPLAFHLPPQLARVHFSLRHLCTLLSRVRQLLARRRHLPRPPRPRLDSNPTPDPRSPRTDLKMGSVFYSPFASTIKRPLLLATRRRLGHRRTRCRSRDFFHLLIQLLLITLRLQRRQLRST